MGRTGPDEGGPRPQVYARLRAQAEGRTPVLNAPRYAKYVGWVVIAAIGGVLFIVADRANPW